jgi:hypothetical protein
MKMPIACALGFLATAAISPCLAQIRVEIVNDSGLKSQDVDLLVTGDPTKPLAVSGIRPNVSTKLSALADSRFTVSRISAGRIIFSYGGAVPAAQNPALPSARFDKVELTYPGAANLTAVDFFAIPFRLETLDINGKVLQKLTYYASTQSLIAALDGLAPQAMVTTDGKPGGTFARILSPSLRPSAYPRMEPYAAAVAGKPVTIAGTYVGPVAPSPNTYDYSGKFAKDGTITLSGTMTQRANPPAARLTISGAALATAIYTDNGPYTVAGAPRKVSDNDVYAAIYRDLVAGFDFGYVGGIYGSDSAGWYGTTPYHAPYACARKTDDGFYNKYASLIAANSDAYGFPFADRNQPVQVALNPGTSTPVATLRITILPDDALDAPLIRSASATSSSLAVKWQAVAGATHYRVTVSPPFDGKTFDAGASISYTIPNLNPGTPYTVSVTAANAASTSEAIPFVLSTEGSARPISGPVAWHFIAFFTGTFPGDTVTLNGVTHPMPGSANPSLSWTSLTGQPGQTNAYVFAWKDSYGNPVDASILYVALANSPATGFGKIDEAASATFMAANQDLPTYDATGFNLFLGLAPGVPRRLCATTGH